MNINIRKLLSIFLALAMLAVAMPVTPTQAKSAESSSMPEGLFQAALESTSEPITAQGANSGGLDFTFSASGLQAGNANWGIALNGFGRGDTVNALGAADAKEVEGRVQYERPELIEWYRGTAFGLEQGFTVPQSPSGKGMLVLRLALSTDMVGTLDENARGLSFAGVDGKTLRYDHLKVWDADGKELDAQMAYAPGQVEIHVNDAGAAYPVTVDPLIYVEQKVRAFDGAASDGFGNSVAISGTTAIVGSSSDDVGANSSQGSAYIFVKSGTAWGFVAKLTASDGAAFDYFGYSVSLSGNTALVGAMADDVGANASQGSTYIFVKPSGGWVTTSTYTAKLTASDGAADDNFGRSVALSGDTALVGASRDDVGIYTNVGSAYIFVKPSSGWVTATETAKLNAPAFDGAEFGYSVALAGNTALVGAPYANIGAAQRGAAYIFVKPGGGWATTGNPTADLVPSDGATGDHFGTSVALSGNTALVGSPANDVGVNSEQGSAYIFVKPGGGWADGTETAKLTASDGADADHFGNSVALSGITAIVGVEDDTIGDATYQGSAYIFVKPGGGWISRIETAKLTASDGAMSDYFGTSVALSGNTAIVGAWDNDFDVADGRGSVYFYQPHTDLSVSAAVNPASAKPGNTVYLTASITNYGETYSGFNLAINAPLPAGLTYVSSSATHGSYNAATGKWTVGAFASSASATLTIEATVNSIPAQTLTFTASLVGTDTNNSNNSASDTLRVIGTKAFRSTGSQDGWVLESGETTNAGGPVNSSATVFRLGDDASDRQYRSILSFNTASLPDNAVITKITLKIKKQGLAGTDPFTILGALRVDIRKPYFGAAAGLASGDFQAAAGKNNIGAIPNAPVSSWYRKTWSTNTFFSYVNKAGTTQFRLRFLTDDNDNGAADYMTFYSGNHATASVRPTLIIEYYVP